MHRTKASLHRTQDEMNEIAKNNGTPLQLKKIEELNKSGWKISAVDGYENKPVVICLFYGHQKAVVYPCGTVRKGTTVKYVLPI